LSIPEFSKRKFFFLTLGFDVAAEPRSFPLKASIKQAAQLESFLKICLTQFFGELKPSKI